MVASGPVAVAAPAQRCGQTSPAGRPCTRLPLVKMGDSNCSTVAQHLGGADRGARAAGGEAVVQQAGARLATAARGLGRQRLAEPADEAGAAFEADHRIGRRDLEDVAQHRRIDELEGRGIGAQRVARRCREDAGHEGAQAGHAQAFRALVDARGRADRGRRGRAAAPVASLASSAAVTASPTALAVTGPLLAGMATGLFAA